MDGGVRRLSLLEGLAANCERRRFVRGAERNREKRVCAAIFPSAQCHLQTHVREFGTQDVPLQNDDVVRIVEQVTENMVQNSDAFKAWC